MNDSEDEALRRVGPWTVLSTRPIYRNPWIRVREDRVLHPDGQPGIYGVVEFAHWATGVVAVDPQGNIPLVGQHRYPLDYYSWEIPEGGCRKEGGTVRDAAARELREETGLTAKRWDALGCLALSNSVTDEVAYLFLARDLTPGRSEPEPTEVLEIRWMPLEAACREALEGTFTESITVAALLRAREFLRREQSGLPTAPYRDTP